MVLILLFLAQSKVMDDYGVEHTENGLRRALVTFGISRGLNGVISVVQGTEVAIEPVGVGMTFTPGQILDPVNDLIERFSTVVLMSGTAFGVQRVFLDIVASNTFSIAMSVIAILALLLLWSGAGVGHTWRNALFKLATIVLIVRFSVPLIAISSEQFYTTFLEPQFTESSAQLVSTTDQLQELQASSTVEDTSANDSEKSFYESAKEFVQSASRTFDVQRHIQEFKDASEEISEHAIRLIVIFVFQTIILPLGFLWLLLRLLRWVASKDVAIS